MRVRACHKCGVLFSPDTRGNAVKYGDPIPSPTVCPVCGHQSINADEIELPSPYSVEARGKG